MRLASRTPPLIESLLLRKSVGALAANRARCATCHRTPLVGEVMHHYPSASRGSQADEERLVCDLCRPAERRAPQRSEVIRSSERDRAVRVRAPRAA